MVIGIIPAKTPSERLPNKNTKYFDGKPLIVHSVECLLKIDRIDTIVCLTNDSKVKDIVSEFNIDVVHEPDYLLEAKECGELASYILDLYEDAEKVVLTHPTFPLRIPEDINKALNFLEIGFETAIGITELPHLQWSGSLIGSRFIIDNVKDFRTPTQELEKKYVINTAVFAGYRSSVLNSKSFISQNMAGVIIPQSRNIDIDYQADFEAAEEIHKQIVEVSTVPVV